MSSKDQTKETTKAETPETKPVLTGRVCKTCGQRKGTMKFQQLTRNPNTYSDDCLACRAQPPEEIKKELNDRFVEREAIKAIPSERNKLKREAKRDAKRAVKRQRERTREIKRERAKQTAADRELARRELARRRLIRFIQRFHAKYMPGWVHADICGRLEQFIKDVEDQKSPRLMISFPPRHGKSEIASINFPAWLLGHHPDWEIISSSYAVSLPIKFSRKIQTIMRSEAYQQLFPGVKLDPRSQAAEEWSTTKGGGYVAAGVGGGITGKGAHVLIIDDPVKDAEEADSDTMREKNWDWWGSTAKTRLAPGGGVLVIQTRWHDDDLSGRLEMLMKEQIEEYEEQKERLKDLIESATDPNEVASLEEQMDLLQQQRDSIDEWDIVKYPAIAEHDEVITEDGKITSLDDLSDQDKLKYRTMGRVIRRKGDALHPDRFPVGRLLNMKRSMQPRHWSALYQQNPVPDEGIYFTKDMFRMTSSVPPLEQMHIYMAWDLAVGEKQTNDWTVGVVGGLDYQDQIHILDMIRVRKDQHSQVEFILDAYQRYMHFPFQEIGIEQGQLELAIRPQLKKRMRERKLFPSFSDTLKPITDKTVRARPLQGRMQQGMVLFPQNQPWVETMMHELLRFPGGVHDDIVDAMAWLLRMMINKQAPRKPGQQRKAKSWRTKLRPYIKGGRTSDPMAA